MKEKRPHSGLMGIFSVLLGVCAVVFSCLLILQTSVLSEEFIRPRLQESEAISQELMDYIDETLPDLSDAGVDMDALQSQLVAPVANALEDVILDAVYYPDAAQARLDQLESSLSDGILQVVAGDNTALRNFASEPVAKAVGTFMSRAEEAIHYDWLVSLGRFFESIQLPLMVAEVVSGVVAVLSLVVLFVIGRRKAAAITCCIAAVAMGGLCALGFFLPCNIAGGIGSFIELCQRDVATGCMVSAVILLVLGALTASVSALYGRFRRTGRS